MPNGARLVAATGENLPLQGITVTSEAAGGLARSRLRQHFTNLHPNPLDLTYAFPLPADGAVAGYEVRAGDRLIKGRVERRADARTQYEAARVDGRTAALVEEERPNFFTQRLGNIPAATDVIVELTIDHRLAWIPGGVWEWRFPTVVAPRYLGAQGTVSDASAVTLDVADGATRPTASLVFTIADDLFATPSSPSHQIVVADGTVALASDAALDRDIVIRWGAVRQAPGCQIRRALPAVKNPGDPVSAYGLLTIVPPVSNGVSLARDLVLLLDVSGSMEGRPLEHLKSVVNSLIDSLRDDDRLEMVAFSSGQVRYRAEPVRTTEDERRRACAWIDSLEANGGTELISAIGEALRPLRDGVARQVVVVTDGLIGFEAAAVRSIRDGLPRGCRLHTVGVGSASNRAFLRPAARAGRGIEVLIDLDEPAASAAKRIAAATSEPVVIDVVVQGAALVGPSPRLPDLLSGSPVLSALRLRPEGGTLVVSGRTADGVWKEQLDVPPTLAGEGSETIPALWARETIEDLELDLACGGDRSDIDGRIEKIALRQSVSSRLTSWIAIAEQPSVDPRDPIRVERIPQTLPYGMSVTGLGLDAAQFVAASRLMAPSLQRLESSAATPRDSRSREDIELERIAGELRAGFAETRKTVSTTIARLEHVAREIERSAKEFLRELARRPHPAQEREERLHELFARLDRLSDEAHSLRLPLEPLLDRIERLRASLTDFHRQAPIQWRGHVLPTPGRPTVTIEFLTASGLVWLPAKTAMIAGRTVDVVEEGTTRPGPVVTGSLVRVTLSTHAEDVAQSTAVEIRSGDNVLIVAIDQLG